MKQIIRESLLVSIFIISFMILSSDCFSFPIGLLDASNLVEEADLVAKGEVKLKKEVGTIKFKYGECKHVVAFFRIDRVIKGREIAKDGDEINIELFELLKMAPVRFETLSKGEYCIVFLIKESGNLKFFEQVNRSKIPALREKSKIMFSEDSPKHRLAEELINNSLGQDYEIARDAIKNLGSLGIKEAIPYLKRLGGVKDSVAKGLSFAARIELGDFSCISDAVHYIEQVSFKSGSEEEKTKLWIYDAIETIKDSKAVPQLNALTEHSDEILRKSAVCALRLIHDRSSVPYFIKRLHDSNRDVRYNAIRGLAEVTRKYQEWAPTSSTFQKDESQYIQRWEDWWRQEGKVRYKTNIK